MIYKDRYAHGMGVISENTASRSVLVSVSVNKFNIALSIDNIIIKCYRYIFTDNIDWVSTYTVFKELSLETSTTVTSLCNTVEKLDTLDTTYW